MSKRTEMWIASHPFCFFSLSLFPLFTCYLRTKICLWPGGKSTVNVYSVAIGFPEDNGGKNVWTRIGEGRDYYQ